MLLKEVRSAGLIVAYVGLFFSFLMPTSQSMTSSGSDNLEALPAPFRRMAEIVKTRDTLNPRYIGKKRKASQWVLTSLFRFEPGCNSGVSGGGGDRTRVQRYFHIGLYVCSL